MMQPSSGLIGPRWLSRQRAALQHKLNSWHSAHKDTHADLVEYKRFLSEIGYLAPDASAAT